MPPCCLERQHSKTCKAHTDIWILLWDVHDISCGTWNLKNKSTSSQNHWHSNPFLGFQRINEPPNGLIHSNMEYITIVPSYGSNKSSPDFLWTNWTQPQHKVWRINESNAKHARFIEFDSSWPQMCQWEQKLMGNGELWKWRIFSAAKLHPSQGLQSIYYQTSGQVSPKSNLLDSPT